MGGLGVRSVIYYLSLVALSVSRISGADFGEKDGASLYPTCERLSLKEYMQRVVEYNESVQGRLLGFHAARHLRMAELGTFEPALVASGEYVDSQRDLTTQLEATLGLGENDQFNERNDIYASGIEVLTPLGTRVRLGLRAGELNNNLPGFGGVNLDIPEYETSIEVSLEQPLLRGRGFATNLASLRLAALQSEIAFHEYRSELMQVVAQAELGYWQLYYGQEQLKLSRESVELAETVLNDSRASLEAGRGSRLDLLEAEAGLALRRSRERQSFQKRIEALNRLASFFGGVPRKDLVDYLAVDAPVSLPVEMSYESGIRNAMAMNPELLRAQLQKEQERIRLGYAKNQRLPELNLKASFGASGVENGWQESFDNIRRASFPAWTVGLVFRVPIWGGVRGRYEERAADLRLMQAERADTNLTTQLRVGRDTAEQRVGSSYTTTRSLESVVGFRTNLLETRMQSRDIGRMDARSVLEAEQELFVARLEQLQSEIDFQRSLLDLEIISGSLLQLRGLEVTLKDLEHQTRQWIVGGDKKHPVLSTEYPMLPACRRKIRSPLKGIRLAHRGSGSTGTPEGMVFSRLLQNMKKTGIKYLPQRAGVILAAIMAAISFEAYGGDVVRCLTEPVNDVEMSSIVPGMVARIQYGEGSFVNQSTVVLELESRSGELDIQRRTLLVESLKATLDRSETLLKNTSSISIEEVDEARSQYRISVIELELAKDTLNKKQARAPFSGIITELPIRVGEYCEPPQVLLRMVDTRRFYGVAHIDPVIASKLKVNQPVTYISESGVGNRKFTGTIVFISPVVDPASGLLRIKAIFSNPEDGIRPGEGGFLELPSK